MPYSPDTASSKLGKKYLSPDLELGSGATFNYDFEPASDLEVLLLAPGPGTELKFKLVGTQVTTTSTEYRLRLHFISKLPIA